MDFLKEHWVDIAMILVGTLALVVYILQERRKRTEAALLIIQQINEIQESLIAVSSCIVDHKLNEGAFYEMLPILEENYWSKFKHLFVRGMDAQSVSTFDKLYKYVGVIQDQYELVHNLQRNFFFVNQQVIANLEGQFISSGLAISEQLSGLGQELARKMESSGDFSDKAEKDTFQRLLQQIIINNPNMDLNTFWNYYNANRSKLLGIINQNAITTYIPLQIRISMENALTQYSLLNISGCEGYQRILKMSKRKA